MTPNVSYDNRSLQVLSSRDTLDAMKKHATPRHATSKAVIALRNALGLTQQRFAVEVVKTSIVTATRWENSHPPHGDTLLKLADVAREHNQITLSRDFWHLYLEELMPRLQNEKLFWVKKGRWYVTAGGDFKHASEEAKYLWDKAEEVEEYAKAGN